MSKKELKEKSWRRSLAIGEMEKVNAEPPPYSSQPPSEQASSSNVSAEPPPAMDSGLKNLDFTPSPLEMPTPTECITHLKLLHAFAKLRHEVGNQDGLFGIELEKVGDMLEAQIEGEPGNAHGRNDSHQPEAHQANPSKTAAGGQALGEKEKARVNLAERIREKRWAVFVTRAVDRFEKWWTTLPLRPDISTFPIRTTDFDSTEATGRVAWFLATGEGLSSEFVASRLPPLDVLMVWHAYLLNPRAYLEDCMRMSHQQMWATLFPWELIYNSIDPETFAYNPPDEARRNWESSPGLPWESTDDGRFASRFKTALPCPKCCRNLAVPWTRPPVTSGPEALESYLENDTGFSGKHFQEPCPSCNFIVTHEKLRVAKFITDASALLTHSRPMPGTMLDAKGQPQISSAGKKLGTHDPFFPNRIIENLSQWKPTSLRSEIDILSITVLKSRIEEIFKSSSSITAVNHDQKNPALLAKESKIAVRKCLSHYWDNSSPFGLDLVGAVIRQSSFVLKMRNIDWLHSPAVLTTCQRLIVKYHRFVRIVAENPKKVAVPTLDVDLAWHTQQLSPKTYYHYTLSETSKFLNHDDKISENTLHTQFQWTSHTYEKKYGQPYAECACWYCECTREPLRSSFISKISPFRSSKIWDVEDKIKKGGVGKDAVMGVHVSAHNAVRFEPVGLADGMGVSAHQRRTELEELDATYARVLKRYNKKKATDEPPNKTVNDAYVWVWGRVVLGEEGQGVRLVVEDMETRVGGVGVVVADAGVEADAGVVVDKKGQFGHPPRYLASTEDLTHAYSETPRRRRRRPRHWQWA
ncbi:uncharacterized protein BDR25DRAFT_338981 [Lindgomyces ingoldianus]|uniref:Uncharacterized protein n=1 Tax=Lindgomyces ingoldianus TaxID=673940 RepID=A0ACB6RC17_9PLEO|nr:uncharacterized protein BDR25DRAFT_338981 [Lindgomyces ingoldianus]KAF2476853.1 hypothetical protein BDR25DRAFT_338981 [Lindgomyces ingoldianus]